MTPYYQDSAVTIYHGDSRELLPQLFGGGGIDMVLTDPPYGTENLGGGYGRRQNHGGEGRKIVGDQDLSVLSDVIRLLPNVLNAPSVVASFCASRRMNEVDALFRSSEFDFFGELIWDKAAPGLGYTIRYSHETCLVYKRGEVPAPAVPAMSMVRAYVSHVATQDRHPHEKPVVFWLNVAQLLPGKILDPFCGSGTVLRAAKDLGREAIGIELDERWCELAATRMAQEVLAFA